MSKRKGKLIPRLKPLPNKKYTPAEIRELVNKRAYVLRVYDNPKPHDVLMKERYDPYKSEAELINHWLELSDVELMICKPQFIGLPVILEHMGNDPEDPGYRPMLNGFQRKTSGIVTGVEQDSKGNTDVILRCFDDFDGQWLCHHLETCFQGASIQHTRTPGDLNMSLREISVVLLGKHPNTDKIRIIELDNPSPIEQKSTAYKHIPSFDFSKHEEMVRSHPLGQSILLWRDPKNQVQESKRPKIVSLSSVISPFSLSIESENKMSNDSTAPTPASAVPAAAAAAAAAVAPVASSPASAPSVASDAAAVPASSSMSGNVPVAAAMAPVVSAPAPVPAVVEPVAMDTSSDAASSSASKKRPLEQLPQQAQQMQEDERAKKHAVISGNVQVDQAQKDVSLIQQMEQAVKAWIPTVSEKEEPAALDMLNKLTAFKADYLNTMVERDSLKKDSQFYQGQMDYMHAKFMDDLQNLVRFVMANYSDPDQEAFDQTRHMDPRNTTVNDMVRQLGQIVGRASSSVDIYNSVAMRKSLKQKGPVVAAAPSAGVAMDTSAGVATSPMIVSQASAGSAVAPKSAVPVMLPLSKMPLPGVPMAAAPAPAPAQVPTPTTLVSTASAGAGAGIASPAPVPVQNGPLHKALDRFVSYRGAMMQPLQSTRGASAYMPPDRSFYYPPNSTAAAVAAPVPSSQKPAPMPTMIPEPTSTSAISEASAAVSASSVPTVSTPLVSVASAAGSTGVPVGQGAIVPGSGLARAYQEFSGKPIKSFSSAIIPQEGVFERMKAASASSSIAGKVHGYSSMM